MDTDPLAETASGAATSAASATRQTLAVAVDHGYRPSRLRARAGTPLRLVFTRSDSDPCTERVVFSNPHLERRLAPAAATVVDLPPLPPGEIRFTCAMGRYRGQIDVIAGHPRNWRDRVVAALTGRGGGSSIDGPNASD